MSDRKPVIVLQNPDVHGAAELIREAVLERKALVIVGNCARG